MAISYPLATPTTIGIESIELRAVNAVAISQSPFTFQQQVISHGGQKWEASVSIPPVRRDLAAPWKAMLTALKGQTGTFLLGDPDYATPQGTALSFKKNLLTFTEKFDNAAWVKSQTTVTPNAISSPDTNTTADKIVDSAVSAFHFIYQTVSISSSVFTCSVYFKAAELSLGSIQLFSSSPSINSITNFNLSTEVSSVITTTGLTGVTSDIEGVGSGWYRCSVSANTNSSVASLQFRVLANDGGLYTGNGTSGIYAWGTQIESGSLTDYQPIADAYGPFVNGGSQTGDELQITGASPNEESYFKAGDYIQLGSGSGSRLHTILTDVVTDDLGQATLDIWPSLRSSPSDGSTVIVENCKGVFRLSGNMNSWSINNASAYGISFEAVESIL